MRTTKHQGDTPNATTPGFSEVVMGEGTAHLENQEGVLTPEGDLAIDGGKLPGRHDDFQGELDQPARPVAGAHGEGAVKPPNSRDIRQ
jgi:hypothetical protein